MCFVWGGKRCIQEFGDETRGKGDRMEEPGVDCRIMLKLIFKKREGNMDWTDPATGTGGGILWMRQWTYGFNNMRRISWLDDLLLASQKGLFSMELVTIGVYVMILPYGRTGRDSSVGIATRYGLNGPGIDSRWGWDFPHPSRPALGPTQPPVQWVPGLSRG